MATPTTAAATPPAPTTHAPRSVQAPASTAPTPRAAPRAVTPPPAGPAKPAKPSKLGAVVHGAKAHGAWRFFFYGSRGVGKTTLAADLPGAIWIDLEDGSDTLYVSRYPVSREPTWPEVLDAIDDLATADHKYTALVIDEVGRLESLLWRHLVATAPADRGGDRPTSIEEIGGGFGKGYVAAEQEWRRFVERLDGLRQRRGMAIVLLGHSAVATVKNPTGENYDRHTPQIDRRAAAVLTGWADVVGFATFADVAKRTSRKVIGATGRRVVYLEHTAAWDAKSRLPMPAQIDLAAESPWAPFAAAIADLSMTPAALRTQLAAELDRLGPRFLAEDGSEVEAAKVQAAIARAGDNAGDLHRYLQRLRQSSPAQTTTDTDTTE